MQPLPGPLSGSYRAGFTVLALVAGSESLLFLFAKKPQSLVCGNEPVPDPAVPRGTL